MIDFNDVMFRVKQILQTQNRKKRIFDKDIAHALVLSPQNYAVMKKRKKIPYPSISSFSQNHNLNMNWVLLNQNPKYLPQPCDS
jgi:hypothetical protein